MEKPLEKLEVGYIVLVFKAKSPRQPVLRLEVARVNTRHAYLNDGTMVSRSLGNGTNHLGEASVYPAGASAGFNVGNIFKLVPNASPLPPYSVNPHLLDPTQKLRAVSMELGEEGEIVGHSALHKHLTLPEFARHMHQGGQTWHSFRLELLPCF